MIVMRGFIEVVSPSSLFLGTVLSRVGCASAEAKGLPAGKLVCPGGDLLDRNSIPSKAVRSDPRLRALPQAWRCLKESGDGWVSNAVLICFPWMSLPPTHHCRRDGISHRGPTKTSLEHQKQLALLPMWTDPSHLCII